MNSNLYKLLEQMEKNADSMRDKGTRFENLVQAWLRHDQTQSQFYDKVWPYADWAKAQGLPGNDAGIDLVARRREDGAFTAIQCKFYARDYTIQKSDLDSFLSASGKSHFVERLFVDTTAGDLGRNAAQMIDDQEIEVRRLGLSDLAASLIDWSRYAEGQPIVFTEKKRPRPHQLDAIEAVEAGLAKHDRGKMIMACGTGKTFTALRITEEMVAPGGVALVLVPSLALLSQTVTEWKNDASTEFRAFAVCSDGQVGRHRNSDDIADLSRSDLAFPSTTNGRDLAKQYSKNPSDQRTVVFSTYQSIAALHDAQKHHNFPEFDLIICDEAHRTTGVTLDDQDKSAFVSVHDQSYLAGKKRLYMTATPKIYGEKARAQADTRDADVYSMDDETIYGPELFRRGFSWAVENDLLCDYKVIVLAVDEETASRAIQKRLEDENAELKLDDASKIVGCYKALAKQDLQAELEIDPAPMRKALAFCKDIKTSKIISREFLHVANAYAKTARETDTLGTPPTLKIEAEHVDGTFNAKSRGAKLDWLKADAGIETCRILSNARCLSEGVDVPALDAILFLHPRKSIIDVVQSVGRVMRRAEGKKMGYVILPVAIPPGMTPSQALKNNKRFEVIWSVLNALRAHDERLEGRINQIDLGEDVSDKIALIDVSDRERRATTAVVDDLPSRPSTNPRILDGDASDPDDEAHPHPQGELDFVFDEFAKAIKAKMVDRCGTRDYWEEWSKDIAEIAQKHIVRIKTAIEGAGPRRDAFQGFLDEIRDDLNPSVSEGEAVEMLAQHLITKPVFEALFKSHNFVQENPVSKAMQTVLGQLEATNIATETESLDRFYDSVKRRAKDIKTAHGKQQLIVQLYDKFFKNAFPAMTQRLGIVYTPVEVVDFILHSVNDVLKSEFGQTLGSKGVHILDPFVGTGTFITRLLQSGLIAPDELAHKYQHEIHANEIVLLAYYIAAINIEATYHDLSPDQGYERFPGMVLTDTFQLYEQERDMIQNLLPDNSERRTQQKQRDIRVIVGNPPYSAGQKKANDDAANLSYPSLDKRIRNTYAEHSKAKRKAALYDSYIRAIRWASDRIGDEGIVAFVSNAGWIDGNATDGLRKCLVEDYSSLYIFHLRGNQRTSGELSRREGGKIFGSGSRAPIAIFVLVKLDSSDRIGQIHFHDIGDYLDQKQKLQIVQELGSIDGIQKRGLWSQLTPDHNHDWLDQVDRDFESYQIIGDKDDPETGLFPIYSSGVVTSRDAWCYNHSTEGLGKSIERTIKAYNLTLATLPSEGKIVAADHIDFDTQEISWSRALIRDLANRNSLEFSGTFVLSSYRPFTMSNLYFDRRLNEMVYQTPKLFPQRDVENLIIQVAAIGAKAGFSCLMVNKLPDFQHMSNGQCFPLYTYEPAPQSGETVDAFAATPETGFTRHDGISDAALAHFRAAYPGEQISKENLFYYIYGLLHAPDYRSRYKNNLAKALPRIPPVKTAQDFWAFSKAGRALGDLHVNYETVEPFPLTVAQGDLKLARLTIPYLTIASKKCSLGKSARKKTKPPSFTTTRSPSRAFP